MSFSSGVFAIAGFLATIATVVSLSVLAERWLEGRLGRDESAHPSAPSTEYRERVRFAKRNTAGPKAA